MYVRMHICIHGVLARVFAHMKGCVHVHVCAAYLPPHRGRTQKHLPSYASRQTSAHGPYRPSVVSHPRGQPPRLWVWGLPQPHLVPQGKAFSVTVFLQILCWASESSAERDPGRSLPIVAPGVWGAKAASMGRLPGWTPNPLGAHCRTPGMRCLGCARSGTGPGQT